MLTTICWRLAQAVVELDALKPAPHPKSTIDIVRAHISRQVVDLPRTQTHPGHLAHTRLTTLNCCYAHAAPYFTAKRGGFSPSRARDTATWCVPACAPPLAPNGQRQSQPSWPRHLLNCLVLNSSIPIRSHAPCPNHRRFHSRPDRSLARHPRPHSRRARARHREGREVLGSREAAADQV